MTPENQICENCGRTEDKHFSIMRYCSEAEFEDFQELEPRFKAKQELCECGHDEKIHHHRKIMRFGIKPTECLLCPCEKLKPRK